MKNKPNTSPSKGEITKDRVVSDLRRIGLTEGDHVAVVLSFKNIGYMKGGPDSFIDALLEVLGLDGTIMMNTFTKSFPASDVEDDFIFDYRSTPAWTGLVPETLRKREDSIRSRHPICSVAAIGRLAKALTEGHDENAPLYLPYSRLADVGGKYLCVGLENNLVAIRHEAQHMAGMFDIVPIFKGVKYLDHEGKVKTYVCNSPPCAIRLPELVPILMKMDILRIGKIGLADSIFAPAGSLLNAMAELLKENPSLTLCDNIFCLWCREFERRMNLYGKIRKTKYFQKNFFIRKAIAQVNRVRLKYYPRLEKIRIYSS